MDLQLTGRTAIVLASTKGLGKATAFSLGKEGANVVISGRDEATLQTVAAEFKQEVGREPLTVVTDVTKPGDIERLVQLTAEKYRTVDILITNAGGPPAGTFEQMTDDHWQLAFELNLLSVIRSIRAVLPYMREQRFGRIVNFASSSFKQPIDNLILSNTFRTGIVGLAKTLATELGPDGILINTVGPGRIGTDRLAYLDSVRAEKSGQTVEEIRQQIEATIPVGRYGEPDEFARVITFLASPANSYVTGQSILVDGGMVKAI